MPEYFEVIFVVDDTTDEKFAPILQSAFGLVKGKNYKTSSSFSLLSNRQVILSFDSFSDYQTINISLDDLHFTNSNFSQIVIEILKIVNVGLSTISNAIFAVGIFEIGTYYLEKCQYINEINTKTLRNFPLLFYRKEDQHDFDFKFKNTICQYNQNAQQLID